MKSPSRSLYGFFRQYTLPDESCRSLDCSASAPLSSAVGPMAGFMQGSSGAVSIYSPRCRQVSTVALGQVSRRLVQVQQPARVYDYSATSCLRVIPVDV